MEIRFSSLLILIDLDGGLELERLSLFSKKSLVIVDRTYFLVLRITDSHNLFDQIYLL